MEGLDGELRARKRKMKFDKMELKVLVEEVNKHIGDLQQKNLTLAKKNAIWETICQKVNAVGRTTRTTDDIKRRWQDLKRRTKEKISFNKTSANVSGAGPSEEVPLSTIEQQVLLTFWGDQIIGIPAYETLEPLVKQESIEVELSPSHSATLHESADATADPQKQLSDEDVDQKFLPQQKTQSPALEDGLSSIAQEVRAVSSVARALRRDTQAIAAHTRQLVSTVSGLTQAITALTRGIEEGVRAMVRFPNCPVPEPPWNGEGEQHQQAGNAGGEHTEEPGNRDGGHSGLLSLRKRQNGVTMATLAKRKK